MSSAIVSTSTSALRDAAAADTGWSGSVGGLVDRFGRSALSLLAVWAHPDDESYLGAGLMAEVARRGGRVVNVCASLGESGTSDPEADPPAELAGRREAELGAALAVLGVERSVVLGYPDGGCDRVDDAMGARRVGSVIDEVGPDLVVTFGPDGVTGHPDHRAVARWSWRAVAERGHRIPLLTSAAGTAWPEHFVDRMHGIGAFWPGYPQRTPAGADWVVRLDGAALDNKMAALACHRSQIGPLCDVLGAEDYRGLAAIESYRPANRPARRRLAGAAGVAVA